jgi:hypothetical protein
MSSTVPALPAMRIVSPILKGLVHRHDHRAQHVGEGVLRREREGQAADAEAGEQRLHVEAEALHHHEHAEDDEDREQRLLDPRHERRHAHLFFLRKFLSVVEQPAEGPQQRPEDDE